MAKKAPSGDWADQMNAAATRQRGHVESDPPACDPEMGHCYHLEADPSCTKGAGRLQRCCHGDSVRRVGG